MSFKNLYIYIYSYIDILFLPAATLNLVHGICDHALLNCAAYYHGRKICKCLFLFADRPVLLRC